VAKVHSGPFNSSAQQFPVVGLLPLVIHLMACSKHPDFWSSSSSCSSSSSKNWAKIEEERQEEKEEKDDAWTQVVNTL
jgi:hypothetical protein